MSTLKENKEYFKSNQFGMMIHFGLYSTLSGKYQNKKPNDNPWTMLGEWVMYNYAIPVNEYEKISHTFNPIHFNAEKVVKLAIEAGMKYIVFTAKHHEGFAMFDSKVSKYNIVDSSPYKKDIVKELADACKKHDIKFGLYYSEEFDWHEPNGGGYGFSKEYNLNNYWDFKNKPDYNQYFEEKVLPQVDEITKNYGDLFIVWFDTPVMISKEQSQRLYNLVRKNQPGALINTRIGNGLGDYTSLNDNDLESTADGLVEVPATLNDTWGYVETDQNWKTAEEVYQNLAQLNQKHVNYLLNIGPDGNGNIPLQTEMILKQVGKLIRNEK